MMRMGREMLRKRDGERLERAPCSPSDALLKVKVFHPSLAERMNDGRRYR